MKKRPSLRLGIGILIFFCVFYFLILSGPVEYEREEVENYDLSNSNSFRTTPYYTKSTHVRTTTDVTIITQVSADRLSRIQDMVNSWNAPISVAVYIKQEKEIQLIDQFCESSESIRSFVDFHILYSNKTRYPVNNLRNLALTHSRTSLVLILDADFVTSSFMHDYLSSFGTELKTKQKLAYVIPAFSSDLPSESLPKTKEELKLAIDKKTVKLVNEGPCPKCHGPTDYPRWLVASEPYDIEYKWIYEPYLLLNKDILTELYDERLKGYGFDKNTHTYTLAVAGYKFAVLPSPFVIHLNHPEAAWDGPSIQQQLWEALEYVCDILPTKKHKYGYSPNQQLFGEPVGLDACFSRDHW